jgi:hypothetical protein
MISVGTGRSAAGTPVMVEKAYPTTERIFGEWGPSEAEEARRAGLVAFLDGMPGADDLPHRRHSHSSGDL